MDELRLLQRPPAKDEAASRTLNLLNSRFSDWNALLTSEEFDGWAHESEAKANDLKGKLAISTETLSKEQGGSTERVKTVISSAQDTALSRHILADDFAALSTELVSSYEHGLGQATLLEDLEDLHRRLKEQENVQHYIRVIERALNLSTAALDEFKDSSAQKQISATGLGQYVALQTFVKEISVLCGEGDQQNSTGEPSSIGLVSFLESVRDRTWIEMKTQLFDALVMAAEKLKWPAGVDWKGASAQDRELFVSIFLKLLKLQEIGEALNPPVTDPAQRKKDGLYPIQALVQPIAARFKYHFEGQRETNRIDKPEWYFTHVLNMIHQNHQFVDTTIQTLLGATRYKSISAQREYTRLLFPMLGKKLRKSMPELLQDPALLAQTIYQALLFDSQVKDDGFSLSGTYETFGFSNVEEWEGISDVILGKKEWFDAWLEGERRFAEAQYDDLVHSPDAWQLVDDGSQLEDAPSTSSDLRPTNSARRVKALFDQITDRYKPLPRFNHRARFLIAIQIPILEHYHTRITGSLDAFETLSSSIMRAVPGALAGQVGHQHDTRRLTSGVDGLQRLIKAFVSARWITIAMQKWGEQIFYLELWKEINERASLRAKAEALSSLPTPHPDDIAEGTLFDELIVQYATLTARSEDLVVRHVVSEVEGALNTHMRAPWNSTSDDQISLPSTLLAPVTAFQQQMAFIASVLPASSVTILYRQIASLISSHLVDRAVLHQSRGKLEPDNVGVLAMEYQLWIECSKQSVGRMVRRLEVPWERLRDATTLLGTSPEDFSGLVQAAWGTRPEAFEEAVKKLGAISFNQSEVRQILRLRSDCAR